MQPSLNTPNAREQQGDNFKNSLNRLWSATGWQQKENSSFCICMTKTTVLWPSLWLHFAWSLSSVVNLKENKMAKLYNFQLKLNSRCAAYLCLQKGKHYEIMAQELKSQNELWAFTPQPLLRIKRKSLQPGN